MKINVSKTDIKKGVRGNCHACPVARAIRRAKGLEGTDVAVGSTGWVRVKDRYPFGRSGDKAPEKLKRFITSFDLRQPVESFSFDLR